VKIKKKFVFCKPALDAVTHEMNCSFWAAVFIFMLSFTLWLSDIYAQI